MKTRIRNRRKLAAVAAPLALAATLTALPAVAGAQGITDQEVRDRILTGIRNDIPLEDNYISVEVNNGTARIDGTVDNYAEKTRVRRIASNTMGVDQVFIDVDLNQTAIPDQQIRSDVMEAFDADPATDEYELDATVSDGVVTLSGNVQTVYEKQLAEDVAGNVNGVVDIVNTIDVDRDYVPEEDMFTRLGTVIGDEAPYYEDNPIDYDVTGGDVTFTGAVDTIRQREELAQLAYGEGADDVDTTELNVDVTAEADNAVVSDEDDVEYSADALEIKIKRRLMRDPRLSSWSIDATVDDAVARLSGTVDNLKAKRRATQIARETMGIYDVENAIEVRSAGRSEDELELAVGNALARDPFLTESEIRVQTSEGGSVTLMGEVPTIFEKGQAEDVASRLEGVTFVYNELTVEDPERQMAYDPALNREWTPYDYDWGEDMAYGAALSDNEIRERIQDEMWWNPIIDAEEVNIQVDDGVVTLSGQVDSWVARSIARENAYEGGARRVDNDLTVPGAADTYAY